MIGNDIIDLKAARRESNWRRPRFLEKLFTEREQALIEDSKQPETMIWLIWSMKESAYKVLIQGGGRPFFRPKKFCCQLNDNTTSVSIENSILDTQSIISNEYIYTTAFKQKDVAIPPFVSQVCSIEKDDKKGISQSVYDQLRTDYASKTSIPLKNISLKKTANGIPFLVDRDKRLEISISLTHHGSYGAFAWVEL